MQDSNKTKKNSLLPGDGTVHEQEKSKEANWFGASHEPQEEFAEQDNQTPLTNEKKDNDKEASAGKMSEGKPTL